MIGFINVHKPIGMTSYDVVKIVKKVLNESRVGHLGTLDPLASGVLPIAVGKATRLFEYFLGKDKAYEAEFLFGQETDTLDSEGEIVRTDNKKITESEIEKVLPKFIGKIKQIPPNFSAKKYSGVRAYILARDKKDFELTPASVQIYAILPHYPVVDNLLKCKIVCSAGTYIRSLGRDISHSLGTVATMTKLTRIRSGNFLIDDAISIDILKHDDAKKHLIFIETVLCNLPKLYLDDESFKKLKNGVKVLADKKFAEEKFLVYGNNQLYGLAVVDQYGNIKVESNLYEGE